MASQNVHVALAQKPSGCVVWVYFDEDTFELGPFLYFGGSPGEPLPDIDSFKVAKHTKGNAHREKAERPSVRVVNKGEFSRLASVEDLWDALFAGA